VFPRITVLTQASTEMRLLVPSTRTPQEPLVASTKDPLDGKKMALEEDIPEF
jgi:hypothetical protein